jgi:hypothetical protein
MGRQLRVHAGEDVFAQVEPFGRLADAALRHHRTLVEHVWTAVCESM